MRINACEIEYSLEFQPKELCMEPFLSFSSQFIFLFFHIFCSQIFAELAS